MTLRSGSMLGQYEILAPLGAGGMGEVYRARDRRLGREVAVKVLPDDLARDPGRLERFEREARLLASLNHPSIVTIHSVEEVDETRFFTMELVEGRTLEAALASRGLGQREIFAYALPMVEAVAAAHRRGLTHRDLKPANVMLTRDGRVKVLDFGLAKSAAQEKASSDSAAATAALTQVGTIVGTVPYMSPEQLQGQNVGPASDVFSLGAMLYEMVLGQRPFRGRSQAEVMSAILRDEPERPTSVRPELPAGIDRILTRCLEKEPARRYRSAEELHEALRDLEREVSSDSGVERATSGSGAAPGSDSGHLPALAAARSFRTPLIGREAESRELHALLEQAAGGHGSLVTLAGEPGVGKSRLSWDAIERARERGFVALVGNCYEGEGTPAFHPWVEVLRGAIRAVPRDGLRDLLGDAAPELAKLVPELRRSFPDLAPPVDLPAAEARQYLFHRLAEFLERATLSRPFLVLLEDVHWADPPTLLLLQHIAPRIAAMPLVVLATYRDVELGVDRPLAASLRELVRGRLVHRIVLRRLPEEAVAGMIEALAGKVPPTDLVRAIHGETEGNPFFVEEVYHHLAEEGRLFDEGGEFRRGLSLEELDVPEGVRLVLGRRLDRLDEDGRRVLTAAAVLGRRFGYRILEAAVGLDDEDALLERIEAAEALRLIEAESGSRRRDPTYRFAHELVRQTLLQALSTPRRQRLHLRIADALEAQKSAERAASTVAHHLYEAGAAAEEEKTLHYLLLAAEQAIDAFAPEQALEQIERARELLPSAGEETAARLLHLEGGALRDMGRLEEAEDRLRESALLYEGLGKREELAWLRRELSTVLVWQADADGASEVALQAVAALGPEPTEERFGALCDAALWLANTGRGEEATARLCEVEALFEVLDRPDLAPELWWARATVLGFCYRVDEAIVAADAGRLAHAGSARRPFFYLGWLSDVVWLFARAGRWDEMEQIAAEGLRLAERLDAAAARHLFIELASWPEWARTADLEASWRAKVAVGEEAALEGWSLFGLGWRGVARLWRGEWEEALADFAALGERAPKSQWDGVVPAWQMVALALLGRRDEVLEVLQRQRSKLPTVGGTHAAGWWELAFAAVESCARVGEIAEAAALYPVLLQARRQGVVVRDAVRGLVETLCGVAAASAGHHEAAGDHFAAALRHADELPVATERAEARYWQAWALLCRGGDGDRDRAGSLLGEAVALYEEMRLERHARLASELLSGAG